MLELKFQITMSINLQRAERRTDFNKPTTPAQVGPGVYDPIIRPEDDRENVAPFNSMKDREQFATTDNPGK